MDKLMVLNKVRERLNKVNSDIRMINSMGITKVEEGILSALDQEMKFLRELLYIVLDVDFQTCRECDTKQPVSKMVELYECFACGHLNDAIHEEE